jgi:hypothetical protein
VIWEGPKRSKIANVQGYFLRFLYARNLILHFNAISKIESTDSFVIIFVDTLVFRC